MINTYLGIDIGSISTKAVIIDDNNKIITSEYLNTEGNPITAVKKIISILNKKLDKKKYKVVSVGTTGTSRKLIGTMLGANIIKNEIIAHATGTKSIMPNVRTIIEIGSQDAKIILIENGVVIDYYINSLLELGTKTFLSSSSSDIENLEENVVSNYLNNFIEDKKIIGPIVFQGGLSKNNSIVKTIEEVLGKKVYVDKNSELLGAVGIAILSKEKKNTKIFNFNINDIKLETESKKCHGCTNNCEIICILKNNKLISFWGNRCERGSLKVTS